MRKGITTTTVILVTISILLFCQYACAYDVPSEPHAADSMWVEPSVIDVAGVSIGYKFNVTVWVNVTVNCRGWQFAMLYNINYLNATRAGYTGTGGTRSQFFEKSGTQSLTPLTPDLKGPYNETHKYVLHGEAWSPMVPNNPYATGVGSLSWVEFQVIAQPPFTTVLDIKTLYPSKTYVANYLNQKIPLNTFNVQVIPEFSSWMLPLILSIALIAVIFVKKKIK